MSWSTPARALAGRRKGQPPDMGDTEFGVVSVMGGAELQTAIVVGQFRLHIDRPRDGRLVAPGNLRCAAHEL